MHNLRVAGLTDGRTALVTRRPCRAAHHPILAAGRIGGGQIPLPGEVSRAQHGRFLLDARPACRGCVPEVLRQPLGKEYAMNTISCTPWTLWHWPRWQVGPR
jgi:predicted ATPase with chaperone activity